MNVIYSVMIASLLMGSAAVTVNGTAYPAIPYQNPLAFVSGMMNREASIQDANKAGLKNNSAQKKMINKISSIEGINFLNEEELYKNNWSMKALSGGADAFRFVEIYA